VGPLHRGRLIHDQRLVWFLEYLSGSFRNNVFFSVQTNDGSGATYLSAPISWTSNQWHMIALTYSSSSCALYLDGQLATEGQG